MPSTRTDKLVDRSGQRNGGSSNRNPSSSSHSGTLRLRSPSDTSLSVASLNTTNALDPTSEGKQERSASKKRLSFATGKLQLFSNSKSKRVSNLDSSSDEEVRPARRNRSRTSSFGRLSRRGALKSSQKTKIPLLPSTPLHPWSTHRPDPDFLPARWEPDVSDTGAPSPSATALHRAIAQANDISELWNPAARELVTVETASVHNSFGQTPFHLLSENMNISDAFANSEGSPDDRNGDEDDLRILPSGSGLESSRNASMVERQLIHFGLHLFKAYPVAMITHDREGCIPFERALSEWVEQIHRDDAASSRGRGPATHDLLQLPSFLQSHWQSTSQHKPPELSRALGTYESSDMEEGGGGVHIAQSGSDPHSSTAGECASQRARKFPAVARLTAHAQYAFLVLSSILDHLDRRLQSPSSAVGPHHRQASMLKLGSRHRRSIGSSIDDDVSLLRTMDKLKTMSLADVRSEIIRSIASIPDLVKTILVMDDPEQRDFCMSCTLVQRVLVSRFSIGPWLPGMLQSNNGHILSLAIEYLKLISEKEGEISRSGGGWGLSARKLTPNSKDKDSTPMPELTDLSEEVSRLDNFIPSLLSLGEEQLEEAATTRLVSKVLDRIISRPFAVTIVFCDAFFLVILLFGFRGTVSRLLLGKSTNSVLRHLYLANTGLFYFVVREIGKVVSLCMVTHRARIYFASFWNWTDLISTVLALASSVCVRASLEEEVTNVEGIANLRSLLAVTTGFLWLRVLNLLKGINMQLATFVLAILQITRDIIWFCVILLTLVVSFAQIFFTLLSPSSCAAADSIDHINDCSQSEYYLKVYAILLGDFGTFERHQFTSIISVILLVAYSFMVVLVLMNVLIAIASDSYEKCLIRSHKLFGRARVMMVAESVGFQNLLRRHPTSITDSSSMQTAVPGNKTWLSGSSLCSGWSRGSFAFLFLSVIVLVIWTIGEFSGFASGAHKGNPWMSMGSILVTVILFLGIVLFLDVGATRLAAHDKADESTPSRFETLLQSSMLRLLGSSKDTGGAFSNSDRDGWQGRLIYLRNEMSRFSDSSKAFTKQSLNELDSSLRQTEGRLLDDISRIEESLSCLQNHIMDRDSSIAMQDTMSKLIEKLQEAEVNANEGNGNEENYQ